MARPSEDLLKQNKELQLVINRQTPPSSMAQTISPAALAVVPATVKAVADITSLWTTDGSAAGIAYGDGTYGLFATDLAQACPGKITCLGTGYFGNWTRHSMPSSWPRYERWPTSAESMRTAFSSCRT
jgi:hypothetical protein